ncbi:zinc finger and BTB domain-containing protein 7B-like isoform X1 [Lates japonicus]|uniref:Zinc finger and BTB domain-containing protein 7B-like isoform X1 n=1 Tax=Lates japonicus TaxID=270547 RepID=A0AAD3M5T9_LATJO|nr:zinc finger and BTB domain-containing protein 7B-like isoform X1 [Lates japonicus]
MSCEGLSSWASSVWLTPARDILGETVEAEGETAEEQTTQHMAAKRMVEVESVVEKASRRKTDRKKVKKVGLHHNNSLILNPPPASPVSHPSPASDSIRSLPSSQPPSPEQEELRHKAGQSGDPRSITQPGRGAALNGGLLAAGAHPYSPPTSCRALE